MAWKLVFVLILSSAVIGFIILSKEYLNLYLRIRFIRKFLKKYRELLPQLGKGKPEAIELYEWLLRKSPRVEAELGSHGYVQYKPPHANYMISNYAFFPNTLQKLTAPWPAITSDDKLYIITALTRLIGMREENMRRILWKLANPFLWPTFRGCRSKK